MHEFLISKKGKNFGPPDTARDAVMAMDFEATNWVDQAKPTRQIAAVAPASAFLSKVDKINGEQCFRQNQSAGGGYLTTQVTSELIFPGDFWMEAWGRVLTENTEPSSGGFHMLFTYGGYLLPSGLQEVCLIGKLLSFTIPNGNSRTVLLTVPANFAITIDVWEHLAVGRKDGRLYLFVRGKLAASILHSSVVGYAGNFKIGNYHDERNSGIGYAGFNGYIDRVRLYNRCLYTEDFEPSKTYYA